MGKVIHLVYCAQCGRPFRPRTPRAKVQTPTGVKPVHLHCMEKKK